MLVRLLDCPEGNLTPREQLYREKLAFDTHLVPDDRVLACLINLAVVRDVLISIYRSITTEIKIVDQGTNDYS